MPNFVNYTKYKILIKNKFVLPNEIIELPLVEGLKYGLTNLDAIVNKTKAAVKPPVVKAPAIKKSKPQTPFTPAPPTPTVEQVSVFLDQAVYNEVVLEDKYIPEEILPPTIEEKEEKEMEENKPILLIDAAPAPLVEVNTEAEDDNLLTEVKPKKKNKKR